jgi:hypothetical protein
MSHTEHILSSSSSLKKKEVLIYLDGGEIEGSGSIFWNPLWKLLPPLNMALGFITSYSWIIFLPLIHTNSMCRHNFSFQLLCAFHHLGEKNKGTYKYSWACYTRQRLVYELKNPRK